MTNEQLYDNAKKIIDELYDLGSGSWDTYDGKRVKLISWWMGLYSIDNVSLGYNDAIKYLAFGELTSN